MPYRMYQYRTFVLMIASLILLIVGCVSRSDSRSIVKHLANNFGPEPEFLNRYLWHDAQSCDELRRVATYLPACLPPSHPIASRMQAWIDAMFDYALDVNPQLRGLVPKPIVGVSAVSYDQAVSVGINKVYPVSADITATNADKRAKAFHLTTVRDQDDLKLIGTLGDDELGQAVIAKEVVDVPEFARLIKTHKLRYNCPISIDSVDGRLVISRELTCGFADVKNFAGADSFAMKATTSLIVIGSRLIEMSETEGQIVSVLAHELAHVLQAHGSRSDRISLVKGYPYEVSDENRLRKPPPSLSPQAKGRYTLEQEADEISQDFLAAVGFGSEDTIRMHFAVLDGIEKLGGINSSCDLGSKQCRELMQAHWRDQDGALIEVPLGCAPRDPHHGVCYRIYNIDEQNRVHRPMVREKALAGIDWVVLRDTYLGGLSSSSRPVDMTCPPDSICN